SDELGYCGRYRQLRDITWRGSREEACKAYKEGIIEYLALNYVKLLKLDTLSHNDEAFLKERLARLEAEMLATKASLGMES
ncbi:MAG: hypothetical protein ABFD07_01505, partial [Methanobacterium sp.]